MSKISLFIRGDAGRLPLADRSVDLVFGSPPYCDARTYGIDAQRGATEWVDWMLNVTTEFLRVSNGAVIWIVAGVTRKRSYWPAPEGLLWEWCRRGGIAYRPCYWKRNGIPGSGGDQWFRSDVEYALCFKRAGKLPWSDNTAMGGPPKYGQGGKMTNRTRNGKRISEITLRRSDGSMRKGDRVLPNVTNPGNMIHTGATGGGHLGHAIAHENEAPFPEGLAEWFVRSLCPPGGICLDPFSGSGTTLAVCERFGRAGIGLDIRQNQCRLGRQRMMHPHQPVIKANKPVNHPLFAGLDLDQ